MASPTNCWSCPLESCPQAGLDGQTPESAEEWCMAHDDGDYDPEMYEEAGDG